MGRSRWGVTEVKAFSILSVQLQVGPFLRFFGAIVTVLELKPLTQQDLQAAIELDQVALGGLWSLDGYTRELDSPNSELLVLAQHPCPSDGASCTTGPCPLLGLGCLWAILDEGHITLLATHPAYRHQGLGQAMLWALIALARQRGLEWVTLEVRVSNRAAIALYRKFGFQEVGCRRQYYRDNGEDALVLWLKGIQSRDFQKTLQTWEQHIGDRLKTAGWLEFSTKTVKIPRFTS